MNKNRLEAFSDGVLAIVITIMVLELQPPHDSSFEALVPLLPVFLSYVLSFIYIGIYWNNHHHMFQACSRISGNVLWANLHLLFWLSLLPFVTGWMGENHFAALPSAFYGIVLLLAACAYWILQQTLIAANGPHSLLKQAIGSDWKGRLSPLIYIAGIIASSFATWLAQLLFVFAAVIWLIPDRRIEHALQQRSDSSPQTEE